MEDNAHLSYLAICEQYNCEGQDLLDILSREHQQAEQLKTTTVSHKNHKLVRKDEAEWVVVPNTHEAIITQEEWDRCREIDEEHSIGRRTKTGDTKSLCALMYCADCGFRMKFSRNQKMRGTTTGNPHQIVVVSYNCGTYSLYGKTVCPTHYISQRTIEEIVLNDIRSMIQLVEEDEAKARKQFLAREQRQESQQISLDKEKLRKAKVRIAELDGLMQSVYEDKVSGEIPASMCAKLLTKYEAEQNALSAEVQEIEARPLMQKQDEHDVDEYGGLSRNDFLQNVLVGLTVNGELPAAVNGFFISKAVAKTKFVGEEYTNWTPEQAMEFYENLPEGMAFIDDADEQLARYMLQKNGV